MSTAAPPSAPDLDLSRPRRIHLVGIGGAGMSAYATVLVDMGHRVSGSDLRPGPSSERLRASGVQLWIGHDASHVDDAELVAVSTAVPPSNVEVRAAHERGIPVLRRAEILAAIAARGSVVAVAGTHGKTTTSSMLSLILAEAGLQPSFIIGGELHAGVAARWDASGGPFVIEADESDGTMLALPARSAVLTNVEADHLEHYGTFDALREAFDQFLAAVPEHRVVCADDPVAAELGRRHGARSYGTDAAADYRILDVTTGRALTSFRVEGPDGPLGEIQLPVPGLHNARNATGALVMALALGAPFEAAARALARYGGVARRFEFRGEAAGVTVVDDYAHLPGEVRSMLEAARHGGWQRVVAVFQPHRYSRLAALWRDFGDAFTGADLLVVTDVYAAGEPPRPGITGRLVVQAVLDQHPEARVAYMPRRDDVLGYLARELRAGDLCLLLGAGDLTTLPPDLLAALSARSGPSLP